MPASTRALVLSGGGPVGVAWHAGVTASLIDSGIDLGAADLIVGTSAGSIVGAHIALGRSPDEAVTRMRERQDTSASSSADVSASVAKNMGRLMEVLVSTADLPIEERLRAIGKLALESETPSEDAFLAGYAHFDEERWPAHFVCTAIDALAGAFTVWDAGSGVELSRAIASSCAVPGFFPPITIHERRYYDGGLRSLTNSDVAEGHERVVVLTLSDPPADSPDPRAQRLRKRLDAEFDVLRRAGGQVEVISPDADAAAVIGVNLMDPARALEAGAAGGVQGKNEAERVARLWR
jgi:NTE family protein